MTKHEINCLLNYHGKYIAPICFLDLKDQTVSKFLKQKQVQLHTVITAHTAYRGVNKNSTVQFFNVARQIFYPPP